MPRLRRAVALVALLAYLALSTVGAGWVVCNGGNGHVAIEARSATCCVETGAGETGAGEAVTGETALSDCPSCASPAAPHDHENGDRDDEHEDHDHRDCGDCQDTALCDLVPSRRTATDDVVAPPAALPVSIETAVAFLPARPTVARTVVVPRPPPSLQGIACTRLRL